MTLSEKAAYIRGLAEGMELDTASKEGKILKSIIDFLEDAAMSVEDLETVCDDIQGQVDEIDEDLGTLEEDFYGDEDDDCCCGCDDDDDDCDCDDLTYQVTCPACHKDIVIDEDIINEGHIECPNCGELLEFDIDEDDDCDCGCCHHDHDGE